MKENDCDNESYTSSQPNREDEEIQTQSWSVLLLNLLDNDSEIILEAYADDDNRLDRGEQGGGEEEEEESLIEVANADIEPFAMLNNFEHTATALITVLRPRS